MCRRIFRRADDKILDFEHEIFISFAESVLIPRYKGALIQIQARHAKTGDRFLADGIRELIGALPFISRHAALERIFMAARRSDPILRLVGKSDVFRFIKGRDISGNARIFPCDMEQRHRFPGLHALIRRATEKIAGHIDGGRLRTIAVILRAGRLAIQRLPVFPFALIRRFLVSYLGKINRHAAQILIGNRAGDGMRGVIFFDFQLDLPFRRHGAVLLRIRRAASGRIRDFYFRVPFFVRHIRSGIEKRHGLIEADLIGIGNERIRIARIKRNGAIGQRGEIIMFRKLEPFAVLCPRDAVSDGKSGGKALIRCVVHGQIIFSVRLRFRRRELIRPIQRKRHTGSGHAFVFLRPCGMIRGGISDDLCIFRPFVPGLQSDIVRKILRIQKPHRPGFRLGKGQIGKIRTPQLSAGQRHGRLRRIPIDGAIRNGFEAVRFEIDISIRGIQSPGHGPGDTVFIVDRIFFLIGRMARPV